MAMKLQKQEAEEYHRREREKHMRRTQVIFILVLLQCYKQS